MRAIVIMLAAFGLGGCLAAPPRLELLGRYDSGVRDVGATEIVAHDPGTQRLFVTNAHARTIDAIDIRDPASPTLAFSIDLAPFGRAANSVAASGGVLAAAVEAEVPTDPGRVVFFDAGGRHLLSVTVGAMPDMVAFSRDGRWVVSANEGEPSGPVDPEGSVSVIRLGDGFLADPRATHRLVGFGHLDAGELDDAVHLGAPGATPAQDLEPEYAAIDPASGRAFVTCQENNALAVIDLESARLERLAGLGWRDFSRAGAGMDPSDRDGALAPRPVPVLGLPQPDAVAAYRVGGRVYLVTADEGDPRSWPGFEEQARVQDLALDPGAFPDADRLRQGDALGRLHVARHLGDDDGDGDHDRLIAFGGRSVTIRDDRGRALWNSGDLLERAVARELGPVSDDRSDDRGPEPEGVCVASIGGRWYAFVGLERANAVAVLDVSNPRRGRLVGLARSEGDVAPEGLAVIAPEDSPTGGWLLVVAYEVSGTTCVYRIVTD